MENMFVFDLQLFAEGAEPAPADPPADPPAGGADPAPADPPADPPAGGTDNKGGTTLLGGKPEETEEYDFKSIVPEGMVYDAQQAEAFATIAKDMKLTGEQANQLAAYGMKYAQQAANMYEEAKTREIAGWADEARKTLGIDFDNTITKAGAGIEAMEKAIPNLRAALNYTGAGNRIEIIQMMAFIGDLVKEDNFRGFGANSGAVKSNLYGNTNFGLY